MKNVRLLSSLRPLIYVSKIFGVCPFNFHVINNKIKVTISKFGIIYGLCFVTVREIYFMSFYIDYEFDDVFLSTVKIRRFMQVILTVISAWSYLLYSKTFKTVIEELFAYSDLVKKKNLYLKIVLITLLELFFLFTLIISYELPKYFFITPDVSYDVILQIFLRRFSRIVSTIINVQFSNVLLYISFLFKNLNSEISSLVPENSLRKNGKCIRDDALDLIDFYGRLASLCEKINKVFGLSMIGLAIITSIASVTTLFAAWTFDELEYQIVKCVICVYSLAELWMILYSCETVVSEAQKTGVVVHDVMIRTKDQRLKDQLQQFSQNLLHRKIQFTACGLFHLDYTLLYTIAGAITTYLILVIQFQGQSENDGKTEKKQDINWKFNHFSVNTTL